MFKVKLVILVVFGSVSVGSCWIFNEIDLSELKARNVDIDIDMDLGELENVLEPKFSLIYPGTKWCGAGNIADNFDDLGPSRDTDLCCREHDSCPDIIRAGETKHDLTNDAFYSRLNCTCDETFRQCLRKVSSKTSTVIGKMYFNALGTNCFKKDYPVTGCKKKGGWLDSKCVEYSYDMKGEQSYQWFDVPVY